MKSVTSIQIRFADVDMLGHVNNVNLQHYFDLGKTDFFIRVLGMSMDWSDTGLVQRVTHTEYEAQTRLTEPVEVETEIESTGRTSVTLFQRLINRDTGQVKAVSRTVLVAFDFRKQEAVPIPEAWKNACGT